MDPTTENFQYPCLRRVRKVIPRSSFGVDYHDASTENVQTAVQKTLIVNSVKFTEERHLTVKKTVTSSSTIGGRSGVANGVFGKSRVEVDWEVEKHFPSIDHVEDRTKHIKNEEILQWSDVSSLYNDLLQTDQDQRHEKSVLNVRLHSGEQPEGNVRHLTAIKDKQSHEVSSLELSLLDIRALSSDDLSRTDDSDVARLSADDSVSNSGKFENARDSGLYSLEHLRSSDSFGASAESKVSYLDHEDNSFAIDQDKTALKDREKTQIVHQRAGERVPHEASVSIGDSLHDHDLTAGKSEFVASSVSHGQIISSYKDLTVDANNQGLTDDGITSMTTTEGVMSSESEEALEDSRKKKDFQTVLSEEGRDAKISDQFEEDVKALGVGWPVGADTNLSQSPFGTFDEQQDKYRKKSPGFVKGKDPFQHGDQSAFEHEGISVGFDPNVSVSEDQTVTDHSMISGKHIEMAPFFPKGKVPKERGDPKKYEGAFANEDEPEASGIDHSSTGFGSDLKVTGEGKLFGDTRASEGYGPEYEQNREDLALYDVRHKDNTNISADIGKDLMRERQKAADRKDVMQYVEDASLNIDDDDVSLDRGVIPSKAINVPFAEKRQPGLEGNVSSRFKEETSFDFDAKKSGSIPSDQSGLESVFLKSEGQKDSSPASYVSELDKSLSGKSRNRPELGSQDESGDFTEQDSTAHRWDRSEKYASETSVELDNDDLLANQVLFDKTTDRSRQQFVRDDYEQKPNQKSLPESYQEEHLKETSSFKHDAKHDSDIFKESSGDRGHLTVGGGDGLAVKVREGLADEVGQHASERGDFSTTSVDEVSDTLGGQSPSSYGPISSHNVVPFEMSKTPGVTDATLARNQREADNIGATLDNKGAVNDDFRRGLEHSEISAEITDDPSMVLDASHEVIPGKTVNKPKESEFSAFAGDTSHDAPLQRHLDYPDESFDRSVHSEDDQKTADHRGVPTAPINEASAVTDSSISAYQMTLSGKDIEVPSKIQDTSIDFFNKPGEGVTFDEAQDINVYSSSFGAESHVPAKFQENIRGEPSMRLASLDHELPAGFAEDFRQSAEFKSTKEGRQPHSTDLEYAKSEAEKEKHGYIDEEHQNATERGVIPSIAEDPASFELDYQTPGERGLVSEKLVKGPSSISELHSAPEGGSVPSGFMRGATFGLDSERKGDDHDVSKVGEKKPIGRDVLEDVDGAKQSTSKKKKGKKKGGKNQGNATSLPSTDSKEMLLETQKGDFAFQENQQSSTYEGAGSHLEQGNVFRDPLRDAKPSKTDEVAGTQKLQEEKLQEQEENRSRELEEKRRTQELEEQRRIQEFEEQKRLEELAEQKRLEELEEKKRLEKLKEQEHLQNLIVQRQAICQPYLDRLHLHEQKLVSIEKIPSTPENLDEKMTQLEAFQDDLRLLESDLEALEKTKKDEWSEITSGEIESDPLAAAFSNLENLKQLTKKSSDKVQELEEKRRIQKIEEEKKLQELEEKRRAQELEEQRQIQELEEQKRLEELEEQKRLEELEEKKRLEKLKEQERLQDLRVQRQAICQPYLDQLHLCEQKLVSIEKIPSTPEKLDDKKLQLEKFQNDLRLLESDLEALEKTRKDEWSEITSGEIESDPLASALSNLENLKRLAEKSSDAVQELEEKRHIQKIEEEKKLQELEEKRRAQELEEQRQIQELEELKRLEELEEQKRLKELEEKKRLEKLKEQERLQDLRVQRQATCQPYLDQLLLFEQILVNTEKLPSTHEKLDEKKLQLEAFQDDLRLLESDLEALEKTRKDEWSEITSGEIESDPLAAAFSNLENLKQQTKKSSEKVQELKEKRRIQKIEEEKLQALEEKRRAQELEEQRQIQELEEQKRLEELEEKKRLEKLKEQERLQDLRVQRQAICQPYLDQLLLFEQKLVNIEKLPSTHENLDEKKLQLESFQGDIRLLESDLEALEKTRKDEWSEISSGEIESDPLAAAFSNLENIKQLTKKSSDKVQELEEKRRIQKIEEEKKLQELEEKRRAQELEEQRQIQELEEQKRLEELEEQKRLKELEEKKRLEKLKEQERLQDLRVQRQATCQPYLDQLLLFEQILVNTEKLPSTHEKLDEKKLQLETFSHDLRLLEADLEVLEKTKKDEWSEITSGEIESDPLAVALSNLESLKQLTKKSSDKVQELINDHDQKQDQVSKIEKRIEDVHLWYNCALATTLEPPVRTSSSRFVKEQLMDATNVCKELEIKVQELKDISSQVQSLPTDVSGEHHINEKLSVLNKDISTLKASLEDKIRRLKGDAERNDKKQKEVQALDANLANIQKKTFQILKSSESSPSKEELEAWQNLQKPSRDLQKMLKSHLQEQRELVKNVADQHEILKSPTPTASGKLPRKVLTYMPLPLSTEAGDSENSKILEATIQKKVADLKKYWQDLKKNKAAGLDDYVDGQKEFDAVTSLAFQWLDLIESQAPKMAESQDLQRQMKSFRTIHQELLEQLKDCKEIGRSLKDNLPTSCTEQNILLTESLEDLDRRFLLLEDEVKQREQLAVEKRALRKNLDEQIGSIQRLVLDCQRKYDSLSDGKIPSETRLISCQQLNGACRDGLQKLSELRTDLQLRVVQDPSISVPPDLLLLQHQLRDLDAKIAEKKLDLSRTTDANNQYKNLLEQYAEFLETAPEKDRASKPPVKDLAQLKNQLSSHRDFIRDLLNLQTMVDSAFQKVEPTEKERHNSSHNRLNVATRDVLDKANLEVSQIKQAVDKWSELEPQFSQAIAWLEDMKRRLPRQATDKDSIEMLEKQLLDLKSVQKDLENGYGPVDRVLENGHRLLELVSSPSLQLQLDDVAERRKTLSRELSEDLKSLEALVKQLRQFDSEMNLLEKWKAGSAKKKDTISQLLSSGNLGHDDIAKAETLFRELKDDTDDHENHKATAVALGSRILQQRPSDLHVKNKLTELTGYWSSHEKGISDLEARIQNARKALRPSWQTLDELSQHLDDINRSIGEDKDFSPKNREQVRQLLMKYRSLKSDLADLQLNIDHIDKVKEQSSGTRSLADQTLMAEKLGEVNQRHQALCSDVNSRAVNLELMGDSWKEFDCLAKNLKEWLTAELARVSAEEKNLNGNTIKSTLAACSEFSNKLKEKQGKDFESFTRLGSTLTSSADWPADASSVASIQDDLSKQCHLLKEKINGLKLLAEKMQSCMGDYEHVLTAVNNVIDGTSSSLDQLQHTSGCKPETLKAQISSLRTLQKNFDGSTGLIQQLGTATAALTSTCDPASCLVFQNDKMQAVNRWKVVKNQIAEKLSAVDVLFSKWSKYNERYSDALNWLNTKESEIERLLKDNSQANKVDKLKQKQQELIKFRDRLSELKVLSEEMIPSLDSGQVVHIVSEQAELSELARNLQLSLGRHLENLNLADGDQGKFAEQCGEMEKFLKEVESALSKASASYDASDHNVVDDRLRTVKSLTERFVEASPLFQELNHSGLPLSKAESSRLKDLSSRWHKLKPDSKALERKLQQQSLVLSSFSDKCVEWNKFLAGIENTLSADLLGDYNSIVNQQKLLEKFQEEIPLRQQILNSIVDDGRKILESNEGEAVDFGRKLQLLVEQWQTAVRQAGQRKAIVDDIVALWQTYHKLRNQLLSDVDNVKKFVDGHPVSAGSFISLKNLQDEYEENQCKLESMKPTVEKLRSYVLLLSPNSEPNTVKQIDFEVKSLEEEMKTVSTAVSSGADQLQNVLELWKRVLQKMVDFSASLKESTKYLKPDVPTKYDELVAELKTLEELKSSKGFCPDELTRDLERLTPLIPPDNSLVLSQRLHLLKERQSQASGQIAVRCETVRDRLNRWEEFDRNVEALMNKYSLIEDKMNKLDVLSIEDSIATIQNDLLPELECLENEKIKLIGTGKELRLNSSGQRYTDVDDKMSRIHERFAQLKEDLNAKLEKLTNTLKTLEQLDNSLRELRRWLLSMEHQLTTPVLYKTSEPSEIENQLKKQELLQKDIDNHEAPVNLVLNHCNIVLSDPVACPTGRESQAFQLARDKLEFRWKNINDISVQRKHLIEETGQLWNKFNGSHQLFNSWLLSKEQQVASPKTQNMTFDAMRGLLGEIRKLRTSFQTEPSELRSLNLLYCRLAREGRTDSEKTLKKKIDQSNQRWDRLLAKTDIAADHLSHIISVKDDFDKNHRALMGQLSSCNNVLIGLEQQTGPPSAKIINYIKKELDSYSDRINYIDRAGGYLKTKCEPSDAVKIQKNIDDLHRLHSEILRRLKLLGDRQPSDAEDKLSSEKMQQLESELAKYDKLDASELETALGRLDKDDEDLYSTPLGGPLDDFEETSADLQEVKKSTPERGDRTTPGERRSYLGLLKRACRTAIPVQMMLLVLVGLASLVPMCENECLLNSLNPILKFADGPPPL